jgi:sulfatase maturation enzyme AslB (radical SAM superfamily)
MGFPDELQSLGLVLTADCNLRCRYCYQDRKAPAAMPWSVLRKGLDLLGRSRRPVVGVELLGGEPLLEIGLLRRALEYAASRGSARPRMRFALLTNGVLLDDRVADLLAEHHVQVNLSFDGLPDAQDLRAPGSFPRLDSLLTRLRRRQPALFRRRLAVTITVSPTAVPLLASSFEYLIGKGIRDVAIAAAMGQSGWHREDRATLDQQFGRIYRASLRHRRETGRTPFVALRRPRAVPPPLPQGRWACGVASMESLVVDVDGRVYPCAALARSSQRLHGCLADRMAGFALGYVGDPALAGHVAALPERVRAAGIFVRQDGKRSGYGRCASCPVVGECVVCPVACVKDPAARRPRDVPDFLCAFNRIVLSYRRRFPPSAS